MDAFMLSNFGLFISGLFSTHFTARSWINFLQLAYGWSVSKSSHTIANYIWLSGGTKNKHFSRYYLFFTGPFLCVMEQLWLAIFELIDSMLGQESILQIVIDDTTKKKTGKKISGAHYFRNGAGSARQEYRTLWGLNFVYLVLSMEWQGHRISVPLGLRVYLKEESAKKLNRPFVSRSALAREMLDFIALTLPNRRFMVLIDGGYATKLFLRNLPPNVEVIGRYSINSTLFAPPPQPKGKRKAGRPCQKGKSLGDPIEWKSQAQDWHPHPDNPKLLIRTMTGIWHSVLPGIVIRVVAIAREIDLNKKSHSKRKPLEAFFSINPQFETMEILGKYAQRWDIEINIRDAYAYYGLGKDRCRNLDRITAVNSFRILMAAARTLWVCKTIENHRLTLKRFRPWYRHKTRISQLDIASAFEEALLAQGIFPTIRFLQDMPKIQPTPDRVQPKAA